MIVTSNFPQLNHVLKRDYTTAEWALGNNTELSARKPQKDAFSAKGEPDIAGSCINRKYSFREN